MRGRAVVAWGLAVLIACPAHAERHWLPGTPMRITVATAGLAPERLEGRLLATGDTLALEVARDRATVFDTLRIATSVVTRAEVSERQRQPNPGAPIAVAVLMGGLGFVATGFYLLSTMEGGGPLPQTAIPLLVVGTAGPAVLGAWLTARGESASAPPEWKEVPLGWLRER